MDDAFLVQLLQPTVTTIEEEIGQLLGFEIEAKAETRAKKPMSESLYDQAALTLYYTQPEIQAGVDTVSEFASRSIRWDAKNDAQDEKIRTFWKKEMMRQKIEMMIANGFIFGRSICEPSPSWKVRDPQCFKIEQDEKGVWTSVVETVDGKPKNLVAEDGIFPIRLFVLKRLWSDDTRGISSLRSLLRTSNMVNDVFKGLQKFILTLWIQKILLESPEGADESKRKELTKALNSLNDPLNIGVALPPGYIAKLLSSGNAPSQLDKILDKLTDRFFAALRIPRAAIGLTSGNYKFSLEETQRILSRRVHAVALPMMDFLERTFEESNEFPDVELTYEPDVVDMSQIEIAQKKATVFHDLSSSLQYLDEEMKKKAIERMNVMLEGIA